ncbi:MAG: site-2 protease family protein [Parachlamydiales bacterium]|jgi:regulator of sigma E protease
MNIENTLYLILAILGLGFLIFIHELGHYLMAKRAKMRIETFSIGFGKPIFSWYRGEVKWQIGMLPFGGYVKIGGMEKEGNLEPHQIPDGFFGKKPIERIKVALAGPGVNLLFAFLVFFYVWMVGGRDKPFAEFTKKIGFVDKQSELHKMDVVAGDEITKCNGKTYEGYIDLIKTPIFDGSKEIHIEGNKIDYYNNIKKNAFDYKLPLYPDVSRGNDIKTFGVLSPAMYLICLRDPTDSPVLKNSNIKEKDRLLWANGEILFSINQLNSIINEDSVILSVKRNNKIIAVKAYLSKLSDLKIPYDFKNEISDWRYFKKINTNLNDIKIIPYIFNEDNIIENPLSYIDESKALENQNNRNIFIKPLKKGDKILAVSGHIIKNRNQLLNYMYESEVIMVIQRDPALFTRLSYLDEDKNFDENLDMNSLKKMIASLGLKNKIKTLDNLILLDPIKPRILKQMAEEGSYFVNDYSNIKKQIESERNPEKKAELIKHFDQYFNERKIAIEVTDRVVKYNPSPVKMFLDGFKETYKTIFALVKGSLSPKHLSGPVGIVQMVKKSWSIGYLEVLYWLGFISLNLGIMNLLPIPVLDGGHIIFSSVEIVTGKPMKIKTMEKIIIPFVILLIAGIIFVTFHDILRIVRNLF